MAVGTAARLSVGAQAALLPSNCWRLSAGAQAGVRARAGVRAARGAAAGGGPALDLVLSEGAGTWLRRYPVHVPWGVAWLLHVPCSCSGRRTERGEGRLPVFDLLFDLHQQLYTDDLFQDLYTKSLNYRLHNWGGGGGSAVDIVMRI